jgi:membrane peptidoglycan carboxypeptidase
MYDGTSRRQVVGGPSKYAPPNEDDVDYGSITLRYAMVKSVNSVYAQEAVDAGLQNVRDTAIALGIPATVNDMDASASAMALGTATPSALDMAGAYATLANHGERIAPWAVQKMERDGTPLDLPAHHPTQAVSRGTADAVTSVLQDVISPSGTGYAALNLGRPAAGKTGTTDKNMSAWFVGYTPQLATAVGIFRENPKTHGHESLNGTAGLARINGGTFPTQIWTAYMTGALKGTPVARFELAPSNGNSGEPLASPSASPSASASAGASPSSTPSRTAPSRTPSTGSGSPSEGFPSETSGPPTGNLIGGTVAGADGGAIGGPGGPGGFGGTTVGSGDGGSIGANDIGGGGRSGGGSGGSGGNGGGGSGDQSGTPETSFTGP